jgi:hypothetical protein
MTQQQEPAIRSPGGSQTKTGQGTRQSTERLITQMIHKKNLFVIQRKQKND